MIKRREARLDVVARRRKSLKPPMATSKPRKHTRTAPLRSGKWSDASTLAQMESVLHAVADAITVQDPKGKVIFANDEAVRLIGYPSAEALLKAETAEIMQRFRVFTEEGAPFPLTELPGRRALQGEERPEAIIRYRTVDGEDRWAVVNAKPVRDARGHIVATVNVFRDVTHRRREEQGQRLLAEASKELSKSLDYHTTLRNIARLAVPHFADWCAIDVVDEDGQLQRLGVAHVDQEKVRWALEVQRQYPTDLSADPGVGRVLRTAQPELYSVITDEQLVAGARDERHLELLRRLGFKSAMLIPLTAPGGTQGVITFVTTAESGHHYDATDLALALELAARAGLAVENARRYSREREVAETMQRALLPTTLPSLPGATLHASYLPGSPDAQVGGDWYDAFRLPDGRMAISIGDVTGRGLTAAVAMGQVRQMIRATAIDNPTPTTVLMRAGRGLVHAIEPDIIATALFGVLDPVSMEFTYSTAGHPPPALATPEGARLLEGGGLPLGVQAPRTSPEAKVILAPGSLLVLYTDGIIEPTHDVASGIVMLLDVVQAEQASLSSNPAQGILNKILGANRASDDAAVLTISADAEPLKGFTLAVPSIPSSQPLVRQAMRMLANRVGISPQRTDALLVALGEAVTNVIEHAYGTTVGLIYVRGSYDKNELTVEIEDRGQWRQARQGPPGYGLMLMRALVDAVDIEREPNRTIVRLRAKLPEVPRPTTGGEAEH